MPVGPSHSGRSGGGSRGGGSFGGGSRSSGGSSFSRSPSHHSSHSGGGFHFSLRPRNFYFFGRTVYLTSGFQVLISLLLFVALLLGGFTYVRFSTIGLYKEDIADVQAQIEIFKQDDVYFKNLITNAKNGVDGYYLTTATFDSEIIEYYSANPSTPGVYYVFTKNGNQWHFIVYEYTNEVTKLNNQIGTTYTQFSAGQCNAMNGTIEIAYTKTDNEWWSINTNYSLSDNQDYIDAVDYLNLKKSNLTSASWGLAGIIIALIVDIALIVLIFIKKSKKQQAEDAIAQEKAKAEADEAQAKADMARRQANQYGRTCEYCGNDIPDGVSKCPGCGSSNFENN